MERFMRNKSLEELVGQLFMVGFEGTGFNSDLAFFLKKWRIGGVILFKRNVLNPLQVAELTRTLQSKAMEYSSAPLLVSIDQEGGQVARLGPPFTRFESASLMAASEDREDKIRDFGQKQAYEMKLVGINMNLAPVLDVNTQGPEGLMASRSYGSDPKQVARLGTLCIQEMQQAGVMACGKHFPGIGDTVLDSHQDLPIQLKEKKEMEGMELIPFQEAIPANPAAIMTAHVKYPAYDSDLPASLSPKIISGLLRQTMGYEGLVITDDLEMGAISHHYEIEEALVWAIQAGSDGLLICHTPEKIERGYNTLLKHIKKGTISEERFKKSLIRVLSLKKQYLTSFLPKNDQEISDYFARK